MSAIKYQQQLVEHYADQMPQWVPQDNAELGTFCAIAIELMKSATPSRLRDAARLVEMRDITKGLR